MFWRAILVSTATLSLWACGKLDPCGNTIVARVASPSRIHDAIVFERDCGATTSWSTQVRIVRSGARFLETSTAWSSTQPGNVFVVDGRAARAGVEGVSILPRWSDDRHLVLACDRDTGRWVGNGQVEGVAVELRGGKSVQHVP